MIRLLLILGSLACVSSVSAQVRLPRLVSDSMVIQRDAKVRVWGWAAKGETVRVSFKGKSYKTRADHNGNWQLWLSPSKAGGPYRMEISASNKITLNDILVGDVWLCAGQSNMVHYLVLHSERYADEIRRANFPGIRQFRVPTAPNLSGPAEDYSEGSWSAANPRNVLKFSVVAYFFAKKLYEKYHIPIGIINASVGGTPIEAWTSEDGLREFPEIRSLIEKNRDTARVNEINREARRLNQEREKRNADDEGLSGVPWYDPTFKAENWHSINVPGYWEDQGIKDLDGVVWYRREIEVPVGAAGDAAMIYLGRIVDADQVYVNGKQVGSTGYQYPQRRYALPAGTLKPGKNLIVVRVVNHGGKGGFVPDKPYHIRVGEVKLDLKDEWHYKVGKVFDPQDRPAPGVALQNQPAALFNGMLAPATSFGVKGFLWYQGESNTGRPDEYRKLLPAMISDWRTRWNTVAPFLFVQLPNFMEMNYLPSESQWAELRDAQLGALGVPNTAMAVAIDLGEWNDIHPGNKRPIGERLALAAQRLAYGDASTVHSGPLYASHRVEGSHMIINFNHVGSGLATSDGEPLRYFAIAGKDGKFVWAEARIRNDNTIEVWSDKVQDPVEVRYAWADNPDGANLVNREGLPASPFRTER